MSEYKLYTQMKYFTAKKPEDLKAALASSNYSISLKKDGASYLLARDLDGSAHVYGDKISKKDNKPIDKIDNLPHVRKYILDNFPIGSQLLAEVTCRYNWTEGKWEERSNSKYVNSIMLCNGDKAALRQQQTEPCGIYVFDILFWDNESYFDRDFAERDEKLKELQNILPSESWLTYAENFIENKEELIAKWLSEGEEGGVLKAMHTMGKISAKYAVSDIGESAKRPAHTSYKIKQIDTIDVVILGVELPEKKYKGKNPDTYEYRDADGNPVNRLWALDMINAFVIGLFKNDDFIIIGTVASGLTDEIRKAAFDDPHEYIGQVIECSCMSIDKKEHSLRHPRLMRFRPDKEAEECLFDETFGD